LPYTGQAIAEIAFLTGWKSSGTVGRIVDAGTGRRSGRLRADQGAIPQRVLNRSRIFRSVRYQSGILKNL